MKISMFCVICLDSKHNIIWDALKKYTGQEKLMESFDNKKIEFYIQFNFMNALGCFLTMTRNLNMYMYLLLSCYVCF